MIVLAIFFLLLNTSEFAFRIQFTSAHGHTHQESNLTTLSTPFYAHAQDAIF